MSQLSPQTIHQFCDLGDMIRPYSADKLVINGMSAGLSCASYDLRIDHDLILGVNPALLISDHILNGYDFEHDDMVHLRYALRYNPPSAALAYTMEDLRIPNHITAQVADKSTYARLFCSAFNTFIDPGFTGNLTLELVNHGPMPIIIKRGDPIVQLIFTVLDKPTDRPYAGKYQHQTRAAHGPRYEETPT